MPRPATWPRPPRRGNRHVEGRPPGSSACEGPWRRQDHGMPALPQAGGQRPLAWSPPSRMQVRPAEQGSGLPSNGWCPGLCHVTSGAPGGIKKATLAAAFPGMVPVTLRQSWPQDLASRSLKGLVGGTGFEHVTPTMSMSYKAFADKSLRPKILIFCFIESCAMWVHNPICTYRCT